MVPSLTGRLRNSPVKTAGHGTAQCPSPRARRAHVGLVDGRPLKGVTHSFLVGSRRAPSRRRKRNQRRLDGASRRACRRAAAQGRAGCTAIWIRTETLVTCLGKLPRFQSSRPLKGVLSVGSRRAPAEAPRRKREAMRRSGSGRPAESLTAGNARRCGAQVQAGLPSHSQPETRADAACQWQWSSCPGLPSHSATAESASPGSCRAAGGACRA